jgi:L-ascorbate metabolism protein UlaG (beta-lactamase superfamily)
MPTELTWLGHNAWIIETAGHRLLLDPFINDNPLSPIKAETIDAQFILLSHGHGDHLGDTVSIAQRTGATVISNFEICQWLAGQGLKNTHPMNLGGSYAFPFGRVTMTLALHSSALPDGSYGGNPCGFVLNLVGGNVYFACDTALFSDMSYIGAQGLSLAALPVGDNFTMGPADSIDAILLLNPTRVVPVHYGTWPIIAQNVEGWAAQVQAKTEADPVVLSPGEKIVL